MEFVTDWSVALLEVALLADGLADALSIDLPVILPLVTMVVQHPLCGDELGHDGQLELVRTKRGKVHVEEGPEVGCVVRWLHQAVSHLRKSRDDSS